MNLSQHFYVKIDNEVLHTWRRVTPPHPISSSVGCLYSVNQQAVNVVFQQQSTSGGTAFKQQSQPFDTSPSHLSAQPSPDVKAHLLIKHSHKTLIHTLFFWTLWPLLTQLPMITQSAFDFTTQTLSFVHAGRGERKRGGDRGLCHRHVQAKTTHLYTDKQA